MTMSELDAVAEAIWRESLSVGDVPWEFGVHANQDEQAHYRRTAQAVVDVLRPTIRTVEQLDALPNGTVVRSGAGTIAARFDSSRGVVFGDDRPFPWLKLALPATVLWTPEAVTGG